MMSDVVLFEELICENGKKIGVATLNSERSLNALSGAMVDALTPVLTEWHQNDEIAAVFLQGAGEKAFCAGGDIVHLYKEMQQHPSEYAPAIEDYFTKEYQLDYLIHTFDKPFVVWGNGIVMGGGLGMMVGASHRVVTESSRIAMPEISIGLYPDVGGSWFLNRMPKHCGLFLGLTGASINAADAKYTKLADVFITADKKEALLSQMQQINWGNTVALNHEKLSQVMHEFELHAKGKMPVSHVKENEAVIARVVDQASLVEIVEAISAESIDDSWFNKAQKSIKHGSALSGQIVYRQLQESKKMNLAECFRMELNLSVKCGQYGEFCEGVRALLIDKDNQPKWKFATINDVDMSVVDWFFESKWTAEEHPLVTLGN